MPIGPWLAKEAEGKDLEVEGVKMLEVRRPGNRLSPFFHFVRVFPMVGYLLVLGFSPIASNPDAKRLYDDLLSNYNRLIRPVSNNTDRVLVRLGMRLSQLIDLVSHFNLYSKQAEGKLLTRTITESLSTL